MLQTPRYDETITQCVSSSHDRMNFEVGLFRSESHARWSGIDGLFVLSPGSRLADGAPTLLP